MEAQDLNKKITEVLSNRVVRKDLVKIVKGNAVVPSYVLEYLLGQSVNGDSPEDIAEGIERVRKILEQHYVHRDQAELAKSRIKEQGSQQIIDKVQVSLNEKTDLYEASFSNLGISGVVVTPETVRQHEKLLVSGIWCICNLEYHFQGDSRVVPWNLLSLKPIQMANFSLEDYLAARNQFSDDEWIALLMQSIGFNPEQFSRREQLLHLVRLIPFVERNYNLLELGPKGTGKSHIYSEFSPHGMLVSGGEVTVPKLFVNNSNGRLGLVGYWDTVAFDEFAGKHKKTDKALVDILKNYMANKSFSRGVETLSAEASMVFVGNTSHNVPYMLKNGDLFEDLPPAFHDSAYADRLHFYIPGWEFDPIRSEMFSDGYGFIVDYLAEALRELRKRDYSDRFESNFALSTDISTRDRTGILKTFSGLMKLLHPSGEANSEQMEELLTFAIEGRKRIKDQILRIDTTMSGGRFGYYLGSEQSDKWHEVRTLEEKENPHYYHQTATDETAGQKPGTDSKQAAATTVETPKEPELEEGSKDYFVGQRGATYQEIFAPYLKGAKRIALVDSYLLLPHQMRNLLEFIEVIAAGKDPADEVLVWIYTKKDTEPSPYYEHTQEDMLEEVVYYAEALGIVCKIIYNQDLHDRRVFTDTGWRIGMGHGLDIFQRQDKFLQIPQIFRKVRDCSFTYTKEKTSNFFDKLVAKWNPKK